MPRLLLRSAKDPLLAVTAEAALAGNVLGNNSGNLLFGQAVHRTLAVPGTEIVADGFRTERVDLSPAEVAQLNEEFDAVVLPLANAFRPDFANHLRRLTKVIEQLDIPVVVVGVGVQLSPSAKRLQEEVRDPVTAFVRTVLDRSAGIGVRGEITAACLADLGFGAEHVEVIGCPAVFLHGPGHHVVKPVPELATDSPIALNLTPTRPRMAEILDANLKRYPQLTYLPQENRELALLLWGEPPRGGEDRRFPLHLEHALYRQDRVRFFLDPTTWERFLVRQHFVFGTRIHGNIAALVAGTPAYLLAFDSRTKELADYHAIPYRMLDATPGDIDAAELYAATDLETFNRVYPQRFDHYLSFFERSGLPHVDADVKTTAFDEELADATFPPAVPTPYATGPEAADLLLQRLQWLRQQTQEQGREIGRLRQSVAAGRREVAVLRRAQKGPSATRWPVRAASRARRQLRSWAHRAG